MPTTSGFPCQCQDLNPGPRAYKEASYPLSHLLSPCVSYFHFAVTRAPERGTQRRLKMWGPPVCLQLTLLSVAPAPEYPQPVTEHSRHDCWFPRCVRPGQDCELSTLVPGSRRKLRCNEARTGLRPWLLELLGVVGERWFDRVTSQFHSPFPLQLRSP